MHVLINIFIILQNLIKIEPFSSRNNYNISAFQVIITMEDGSSIQNVLDQLVEINQQPMDIKEEMVELTMSADAASEETSKMIDVKEQQSPSKKKPFKPKVRL